MRVTVRQQTASVEMQNCFHGGVTWARVMVPLLEGKIDVELHEPGFLAKGALEKDVVAMQGYIQDHKNCISQDGFLKYLDQLEGVRVAIANNNLNQALELAKKIY